MLKKLRFLDGAGCALATTSVGVGVEEDAEHVVGEVGRWFASGRSDERPAHGGGTIMSRPYMIPIPTMFVFIAFPHCSNIALRRRGGRARDSREASNEEVYPQCPYGCSALYVGNP